MVMHREWHKQLVRAEFEKVVDAMRREKKSGEMREG